WQSLLSGMDGHARHLRSVAAFRGCQHSQRLGPVDGGNSAGAKTTFASARFFLQCAKNFFRRDWDFVDAYADGVVDRVGNRWRHRQQRSLTHFLRAVWTIRIGILDQVSLDVAHLHRRWAFVLEHRRKLVYDVAILAVHHLLHQDLAQRHVNTAFDLAHHEHWIDRATNVMCDPHTLNDDDPRIGIHINLSHCCGVTVRG